MTKEKEKKTFFQSVREENVDWNVKNVKRIGDNLTTLNLNSNLKPNIIF